ncbi:MAG: hypothetical protein LBF75_04795 [Treponema sp.]|jgi:hypothetical protein|nr:hypothetical protein [Treponema sp.]
MKFSCARDKYIFTTKIYLDDEEEDYVELREPSLQEMQSLGGDSKQNIKTLEVLFPKCLIRHSFVDDDGESTDSKAVYDMLKESASLFTEIIDTWFKSIPFNSRLKKGSK